MRDAALCDVFADANTMEPDRRRAALPNFSNVICRSIANADGAPVPARRAAVKSIRACAR